MFADDWMANLLTGHEQEEMGFRDTPEGRKADEAEPMELTPDLLAAAAEFAEHTSKEKYHKAQKEKWRQKVIDAMGPGLLRIYNDKVRGRLRSTRITGFNWRDKGLAKRLRELGDVIWEKCTERKVSADRVKEAMEAHPEIKDKLNETVSYRLEFKADE